jgi:hypothetical protein
MLHPSEKTVARQKEYTLSTFDGRLLDGLNFCRKAYQFFDQVRATPDGGSRIRLRPTKTEKRVLEELIPIACYVQRRYRVGGVLNCVGSTDRSRSMQLYCPLEY